MREDERAEQKMHVSVHLPTGSLGESPRLGSLNNGNLSENCPRKEPEDGQEGTVGRCLQSSRTPPPMCAILFSSPHMSCNKTFVVLLVALTKRKTGFYPKAAVAMGKWGSMAWA